MNSAAFPASARSTVDLAALHAARSRAPVKSWKKIVFLGVEGKDVYNPTAPFQILLKGASRPKTVMMARVESRDSETDSQACFFEPTAKAGTWRKIVGAASLPLQDPCVAIIQGRPVIGGVKVSERSAKEGGGLGYRTEFFVTDDLKTFQQVGAGPSGMKDIRLVDRQSVVGRPCIGVFGRPQGDAALSIGAPGPRGSVTYTEIKNLEELTPSNISSAKLLPTQLLSDQWWGVNEATQLPNGNLEVLGHAARFQPADKNGRVDRSYYPVEFHFNPVSFAVTNLRVLLDRGALEDVTSDLLAKKPDLKDVLFSGGRKARSLWLGVGDVFVAKVEMKAL